MIVKRHFNLLKVWQYIKKPMLFVAIWSFGVWLVFLFAMLLPFGLLSFFQAEKLIAMSRLIMPLSLLVAGVFIIMEKTGAANEDPFENQVTDVPLTVLCNTIERDLREMLQEKELPAKLHPVQGYLY